MDVFLNTHKNRVRSGICFSFFQGNAGPAVFWLLFFLLKHPSAMAAVQSEMANIFKANKHKIGLLQGTSQEILDRTPIFGKFSFSETASGNGCLG